jgi:hypothetical protein
MKKIIRLTEADLTRIVRRVINEQMTNQTDSSPKLTPLAQGLKKTIDSLPDNPGLEGVKKITTFCKTRSDVKYDNYIGNVNKMINKSLSGLSNPLNVMGGGSIDDVANIFRKYVKTPEQVCSVIKSFQTESNLADVTFGINGGDFYSGIYGDSKLKINTAQPANKLIQVIEYTIPV